MPRSKDHVQFRDDEIRCPRWFLLWLQNPSYSQEMMSNMSNQAWTKGVGFSIMQTHTDIDRPRVLVSIIISLAQNTIPASSLRNDQISCSTEPHRPIRNRALGRTILHLYKRSFAHCSSPPLSLSAHCFSHSHLNCFPQVSRFTRNIIFFRQQAKKKLNSGFFPAQLSICFRNVHSKQSCRGWSWKNEGRGE